MHEHQHEKLTCCKEQYQAAKYELKAHGAYPPLRIPQAPTPLSVKTMRIKLERWEPGCKDENQVVSMRTKVGHGTMGFHKFKYDIGERLAKMVDLVWFWWSTWVNIKIWRRKDKLMSSLKWTLRQNLKWKCENKIRKKTNWCLLEDENEDGWRLAEDKKRWRRLHLVWEEADLLKHSS